MRVQGIPTTRLKGTATYAPGKIGYDLTGEALGGTFQLTGTYPLGGPAAKPESRVPPPNPDVVPVGMADPPERPELGRFRLTNVRLRRLATGLGVPGLKPLRGRLDVDVRYEFDAAGVPAGTGRLRITNFGWGDDRDGGDVVALIRVSADGIDLYDVAASLAGGDLRGRVRYLFNRSDRSFFNVTLDRAELRKLTVPFGLGEVGGPESRVSVNVRGGIGKELRGTGSISAARGKLAGIDVGDVRLPFEWGFFAGGSGEVAFRHVDANVAGGRIDGTATYRWGASSRLDGNLRFLDVSVRQLIGSSTGITPGRASGRFEFSGTDVQTVNDVSGVLLATFRGEGYLFDLPVFKVVAPFLSLTRLTAPVTEGDMKARLTNGRFNIARLALIGPNAQLFASGLVGLDGRLDLDVVARTSPIAIDPAVLRLFRLRIPALGPIPLSLILDISRALANQTVRLRVSGDVNNPKVQLNVAALLADEAIRFFLGIDSLAGVAAGGGGN
jgi:hypothetical protein